VRVSGVSGKVTKSKLAMVDLAGSERARGPSAAAVGKDEQAERNAINRYVF
jgi:hypothetical protein